MSDFCFSHPMLNRVLSQAELMDRVLARFGADLATAVRVDNGMAWYEARTRCIACAHSAWCRAWVGRQGANTSSAAPAFCANAAFFARCRQTKQKMEER
jgi:hypothetical protein